MTTKIDSPVKPVKLGLDDTFRFQCHNGIACFNRCCQNIDITLTPYDVLRLQRRLGLSSEAFLERCTLRFEMDHHGMPGLKLRPRDDSSACQFVTEEGCSVYQDRPAACRYYALGSMGLRMKDSPQVEDVYFVVKEDHCLGHHEPRTLTVRQYREEQGVDKYDDANREWRDIVIKKRSSGPTVGTPSERSMELFYLASYDFDGFRDFISSGSFQDLFDLDPQTNKALRTDDEALLQFAFRFLKQVLFGEHTIPMREGVRQQRLEGARTRLAERTADEKRRAEAFDPRYDTPQEG